MRADLRRRRDLGEIIDGAYRMYAAHFRVLFLIALITAPLQALQVVISSRLNSDSAEASTMYLFLIPTLFVALVASGALISAVHDVTGDTAPDVTRSLDTAFGRFTALLTTFLLQIGLTLASMFAAPALGIWWLLRRDATIDGRRNWWLALVPFALALYLAIRWMAMQQVVMIGGKERWLALDASAEIVRENWWRTLGILLVIGLIVLGPTALAATSAAASPLVEATVTSVVSALALPFFIAAQTLLYYDLKARNSIDPSPARIDAP